ncbi:MAG TPA: putative nucleotidyltransferase substrate binding domain-containing protein [Solirubrobacterales bacterium]|jgi:CBS domain-containing protein
MSAAAAQATPLEVQTPRNDPVSPSSEVAGAEIDEKLLAGRSPAPLTLRRAIADARDFDQLQEVGRELHTTAVSLHGAQVGPAQASAIISDLADSLTRRSIELSVSELGAPPCPLSWVVLGSHGRREPVPGSDVDSALAWDGDEDDEDAKSYMGLLGSRVCGALARCGLTADKRGATAAQDLFVRPISDWRRLIRESISEPRQDKGLIVISLFLDGRVLHHGGGASGLRHEFRAAPRRGLLRLMLSLSLANKPSVGFLRDFALERSGEHRGLIDIKHGGLLPVTSIARYASLAAGAIDAVSTQERLSAADAGGTLDSDFAHSLSDSFELFQSVRLEHQVHQIQRGDEPDDHLDPKALEPARRCQLRDAFREVRSVQRKLGRRLSGELAFA